MLWPGGRLPMWRWHGREVAPYVVQPVERLVAPLVKRERNRIWQDIMIERYGLERFIRDSRSTVGRGCALDKSDGLSIQAASLRGRSSDGRALQSHCRGQGFDSPRLHQVSLPPLISLGFLAMNPKPFGPVWESAFGFGDDRRRMAACASFLCSAALV